MPLHSLPFFLPFFINLLSCYFQIQRSVHSCLGVIHIFYLFFCFLLLRWDTTRNEENPAQCYATGSISTAVFNSLLVDYTHSTTVTIYYKASFSVHICLSSSTCQTYPHRQKKLFLYLGCITLFSAACTYTLDKLLINCCEV